MHSSDSPATAAAGTLFTPAFWRLCWSTVFFMASFGMLLPELPGFLAELGKPDWVGWIVGLFTVGAFVSRFFSGRMADRAGRLPVMLIGTAVTAISGLLYSVIHGWGGSWGWMAVGVPWSALLFMILRFFHGLSTGFRPLGTTAFLTDIAPLERRGEALGLLGVAGNVGMAAGPALGSVLAVELGYHALFIASSLLGWIALCMTYRLPESLPAARPVQWSDFNVLQGPVVDWAAWPSSLALLAPAISFGAYLTLSPDFVGNLGFEYKGTFNATVVLASVAIRFVAGKASDRHGRLPLLILGSWLLALGMGLLAIADTPALAMGAGVIYGASVGINMPTIFAWTADLASPGKVALALGTMLMALEVGIGAGAVLSGLFYGGDVGQIPSLFTALSILSAASALPLMAWAWFQRRRRNSPPSSVG
ncbi:MAG: hypothetical protein RJA19_1635 [Bacteroidota bacterium]